MGAAALAVTGVATAPATAGPGGGEQEANAAGATCQVLRYETSQGRYRAGYDNQGTAYVAIEPPFGYGTGDNYGVGFEWEAPYENRNWFTFRLGGLTAGSVTKAELVIQNYTGGYGPGGSYRLRQVTTAPGALNKHTAPADDVYDDLGDGPVYGSAWVTQASMSSQAVTRVPLNAKGVAAVNAAAGRAFSLGGDLSHPDPDVLSSLLWSNSSGAGVQRLVVTSCS
ncbi:MAG: hypothetical protein AVDCRST_MAG34-956 [uncultured Nocardioidaceae bacterium]|uniref:Uncharacterized protein n=1 Tax=uncultured Nocardioidaceae bacterium TaxID=253824 RepID=A0A6J4LTH8_9ACTN|nr:MAG: hypothetical protein AVDCRST_MAG34-956 [uncultured Nocardioidaceae bacterium]